MQRREEGALRWEKDFKDYIVWYKSRNREMDKEIPGPSLGTGRKQKARAPAHGHHHGTVILSERLIALIWKELPPLLPTPFCHSALPHLYTPAGKSHP